MLAAGELDASFGNGGVLFFDVDARDNWLNDVALQDDGKIVAVGGTFSPEFEQQMVLARFEADGSPDETFGRGGRVVVDLKPNELRSQAGLAMAIQNDGKVVVAGSIGGPSEMLTARFTSTGQLDTTFGTGGFVLDDFDGNGGSGVDVEIDSAGNILTLGNAGPFDDQQVVLTVRDTNGVLDERITVDESSGGALALAHREDNPSTFVAAQRKVFSIDRTTGTKIIGFSILFAQLFGDTDLQYVEGVGVVKQEDTLVTAGTVGEFGSGKGVIAKFHNDDVQNEISLIPFPGQTVVVIDAGDDTSLTGVAGRSDGTIVYGGTVAAGGVANMLVGMLDENTGDPVPGFENLSIGPNGSSARSMVMSEDERYAFLAGSIFQADQNGIITKVELPATSDGGNTNPRDDSGSIHGIAFEDTNGNKVRDANETVATGRVIGLVNEQGELIRDADGEPITAEPMDNGEFWIQGITPGIRYGLVEIGIADVIVSPILFMMDQPLAPRQAYVANGAQEAAVTDLGQIDIPVIQDARLNLPLAVISDSQVVLSLTKVATKLDGTVLGEDDKVKAGQPFAYTFTVRNQGLEPASDIQVVDDFPPGVIHTGTAPEGCVVHSGGDGISMLTCMIPVLAPGASKSFTQTVVLDRATWANSGVGIINTAAIFSYAEKPIDEALIESNESLITVQPLNIRLSVDKGAFQFTGESYTPVELVSAGETFFYFIYVINDGTDSATNIKVHDLLPKGLLLAPGPADGCSQDGTVDGRISLTCTVPVLEPGASKTFQQAVTVGDELSTTGGVLKNTAAIMSFTEQPDQFQPISSDEEALTVRPLDVRLSLEKKAIHQDGSDYAEGEQLRKDDKFAYVLTARNDGLDVAAEVVVNDFLPEGIVLRGSPDGCSVNDDTQGGVVPDVQCTILILGPGQTRSFVIPVEFVGNDHLYGKGGTIQNIGQLFASELVTEDNDGFLEKSYSLQVAPVDVNVSVEKSVQSLDEPSENTREIDVIAGVEPFRFTISVTNHSFFEDATNVVVRDVLPAIEVISFSNANDCTLDAVARTFQCNFPIVGRQHTVTVDLVAVGIPESLSTLTNTATLVSLDQNDTDPTDNTSLPVTVNVRSEVRSNTGSIRGLGFIDRNGDGQRQSDEPGLANVEVERSWNSMDGTQERESTVGDQLGAFSFSDLTPGVAYTIRATVPAGFVATSASPDPIVLEAGKHVVATQQQADLLAAEANLMAGDIAVQTSLAFAFGPFLQPGDGNQDLQFNQFDIIGAQVAAKYRTGQPATWADGDWNGGPGGTVGRPPQGDGVFDQKDIIAALKAALYQQGPYASTTPSSLSCTSQDEARARIIDQAIAGDADGDRSFDLDDVARLIQGGKYRTGEFADWSEGDWNGDGLFDQYDLVLALQQSGW